MLSVVNIAFMYVHVHVHINLCSFIHGSSIQISSYAEKLRLAQEENDGVLKVQKIRKLQKLNSEVQIHIMYNSVV